MRINLATTVCATEGNLLASVQGEKVILQAGTGRYYGLNEVGGRIWELIQLPTVLSAVVDNLLMEYDVARTRLEQDLIELIDELRQVQLVEVQESNRLNR